MTVVAAVTLIAVALGEGKSGKSSSAVGKIDSLFKAINAAVAAGAAGSDDGGNSSEVGDIALTPTLTPLYHYVNF